MLCIAVFFFCSTKRTLFLTNLTPKMECHKLSIKQECGGACMSAWGHGDKLTLTSYQYQWFAKNVGVYPDSQMSTRSGNFLCSPHCLFMSHHKHCCFKRSSQLSFRRGKKKHTRKWLQKEAQGDWRKLNPGEISSVQKLWRRLITCTKSVTLSFQ